MGVCIVSTQLCKIKMKNKYKLPCGDGNSFCVQRELLSRGKEHLFQMIFLGEKKVQMIFYTYHGYTVCSLSRNCCLFVLLAGDQSSLQIDDKQKRKPIFFSIVQKALEKGLKHIREDMIFTYVIQDKLVPKSANLLLFWKCSLSVVSKRYVV